MKPFLTYHDADPCIKYLSVVFSLLSKPTMFYCYNLFPFASIFSSIAAIGSVVLTLERVVHFY